MTVRDLVESLEKWELDEEFEVLKVNNSQLPGGYDVILSQRGNKILLTEGRI